MNGWELLQTVALTKRLYDEYEADPAKIACDLLALISRVATLRKVPLQRMLDAVKLGARV